MCVVCMPALSSYLFLMMINFLSWNIRGAAAKGVPLLIKDLVRRHSISCLALMETKVSGARAVSIINKLGFDAFHVEEAVGFSGGIWILWDSSIMGIQVMVSHRQFVHSHVVFRRSGKE